MILRIKDALRAVCIEKKGIEPIYFSGNEGVTIEITINTEPLSKELRTELKDRLGSFTPLVYEEIHKFSVLRALQDNMVY